MTVTGSGFNGKSVVHFNGSPRSTSMMGSTQLQTTILASDILLPGIAQITVYNSGGNGGTSNAVTLTIVDPPLTITTTSLPNGTVGLAYSATVSAAAGVPPYSWSVTAGSLATGLSLSSSGTITGTPSASGSYTFTVQVKDSVGSTATRSYTVSIASQLTILTATLPNGNVNAAYSATLSASGGTPPYSWSVMAGSLPTGLSLSSSGTISGTPTTAWSYTFTIQVKDSGGSTATQSYTVSVASSLTILTTTLPNGNINAAYTATLSASGGTPPYTWTVLSGQSPPGLSLSSSGAVSGTPTTAGSYTFTLQVQDSAALTASQPYTVSISSQLQIGCGANTDNSTCGNVGDPYEGSGPPPNQQAISGCTTITTSSTNYKLSGNIGSDPTGACLQINYSVHDITVDLGGYTITGAIFDYSSGNGNTIFNGTVTCNINYYGAGAGGYPQNCVDTYFNWGGGPPTTEQYRLHHLTVNQQNQNGIHVEVEADGTGNYTGSGTGLGMPCRIDHVTWDSAAISPSPDGTNNRYGGLYSQGQCNTEFDDNYIHCGAAPLNQCQGIEASPVPFVYAHNNEVLMDNLADSGSGRAFNCDAGAGVGGTCDIYNNYIVAMHNRAVRYRMCTTGLSCAGTQNGNVYGNQILNIQQGGRVGTIHIGETDVAMENANIQVYGNTLELNPSTSGGGATPGNGIVVSSGQGVTIHDNTVICYEGNCTGAGLVLITDTFTYAPSDYVTILNTTLPFEWGSNPAVESCGPGSPVQYNCIDDSNGVTTVTYCNTGLVVGNGIIAENCP